MSRNASGTFSLYTPGNPVVTGTTIASSWANNTLSDLGTEMTDSLSRSGKGGMLAALVLNNGASAAAPDLSWTGDTSTGIYHSASSEIDFALGGSLLLSFTATGTIGSGAYLLTKASDTALVLQGNLTAANASADIYMNTAASRTAGAIVGFANHGLPRSVITYAGSLFGNAAGNPTETATSPGPQALATPALNTNWTAGSGLKVWKDAIGMVRFKGTVTNQTGGGSANIATAGNVLAAGFLPAATRFFTVQETTANRTYQVFVTSAGAIQTTTNVTNNDVVPLDAIAYLAEA